MSAFLRKKIPKESKYCEIRKEEGFLSGAMVKVNSAFRYDQWVENIVKEEDLIECHCFLPNGSYINFKCASKTTLEELKEVI